MPKLTIDTRLKRLEEHVSQIYRLLERMEMEREEEPCDMEERDNLFVLTRKIPDVRLSATPTECIRIKSDAYNTVAVLAGKTGRSISEVASMAIMYAARNMTIQD